MVKYNVCMYVCILYLVYNIYFHFIYISLIFNNKLTNILLYKCLFLINRMSFLHDT